MSEGLGSILRKLRNSQRITQKELSRGLCSIPTLSRIEVGEREPDQMLFDSLISRLGKDSRKWDLILKEKDKLLLQKRNYIEYLIQIEEWEELEQELEKYEEFEGVENNLQGQYVCMIRAILYKQKGKYEDSLQVCYEGLEKTKLQIDNKYLKIEARVSRNELRILSLIGELLYEVETNSIEEVYSYWKGLLKYIENFCTDVQYRLRFYIQAHYYLASIAYKEMNYTESIFYFQNGVRELQEKTSIYYLEEYLYLLKKLKKIDGTIFKSISDKEIYILLETLHEWQEKNKRLPNKEKYIKPSNNVYSINEIIKNGRYALGKSQEAIIEIEDGIWIGDQASLSEIENGKRNPRKLTSDYYLERLGLRGTGEPFWLSVKGEDFDIQELRWEIDFSLSLHHLSKAKALLSRLKRMIDLSEVENEQYVRQIELFIKNKSEEISCEQWKSELLSILSLTIPNVDVMKERAFFTREELFLIMNLGCMYHKHKEYKKALNYYEWLEKYFYNDYPLSSAAMGKTLLYNLSQVYGLLGCYEKSMEKIKICIFLEMLNLNSYIWSEALYNLGWCYGKMMLQEQDVKRREKYKEYYYKFFQQSYSLAVFYKNESLAEEIQNKFKVWNKQ